MNKTAAGLATLLAAGLLALTWPTIEASETINAPGQSPRINRGCNGVRDDVVVSDRPAGRGGKLDGLGSVDEVVDEVSFDPHVGLYLGALDGSLAVRRDNPVILD